ncbi:MAG: hypothetical protein ABSC64_02305 [Candidatus Korobacteraceae bacterium]
MRAEIYLIDKSYKRGKIIGIDSTGLMMRTEGVKCYVPLTSILYLNYEEKEKASANVDDE